MLITRETIEKKVKAKEIINVSVVKTGYKNVDWFVTHKAGVMSDNNKSYFIMWRENLSQEGFELEVETWDQACPELFAWPSEV